MSVRRRDLRRTLWTLRLAVTVSLAAAVIVGLLAAGFWNGHALLTNLLASLLVVIISVVLIDRELDRRTRGRWNVLAHYVLYDLNLEARTAWTQLGQVVGLTETTRSPPPSESRAAAQPASATRTSAAVLRALGEPHSRSALQHQIAEAAERGHVLVAQWSGIMLASGPFMELMDRHVELYSRLAWLRDQLHFAQDGLTEAGANDGKRERSALASPQALDENDLARHLSAIFELAHDLDIATTQLSRDLIPPEWWRVGSAPSPVGSEV